MRIAWGITGSGHLMLETFDVMARIAATGTHTISIFMSKAGEEVARMYGILPLLRKMANGPPPFRFVHDIEQAASYPACGKFNLGIYPVLFIGPATANTVAKIKVGIADTLVTNIAAMAAKGGAKVIIMPSDFVAGPVETTLPVTAKNQKCAACTDQDTAEECTACDVVNECPTHAISIIEDRPIVDLTKCIGCKRCVELCNGQLFEFGRKITINIRQVDSDNARAVGELEGVEVIGHPLEFEKWLLSQDSG
ncbi:MAG TPA: flavoprotein [Candidatus Lokiarchaeia archaeon]|nr:flavoprotein [Candidatus Lokiarchaeia archaeon]